MFILVTSRITIVQTAAVYAANVVSFSNSCFIGYSLYIKWLFISYHISEKKKITFF